MKEVVVLQGNSSKILFTFNLIERNKKKTKPTKLLTSWNMQSRTPFYSLPAARVFNQWSLSPLSSAFLPLQFHLVGIDGNDIREGNKTLTLALVWQLMRAYTLSILKNLGDGHPVVEQEIIKWANEKVRRTRDEKKPTPITLQRK